MKQRILAAVAILVASAAGTIAQQLTTEKNVDYYGGDYTSFVPKKPSAQLCSDACAKDKRCVAYTFARPSSGSPKGRCYLKAKIGKRRADKCCESGLKNGKKAKSVQGKPASNNRRSSDRGLNQRGLAGRNIRRTPNLLKHLPSTTWNLEGRTLSGDRRFQSIPLRPASRPRIGPVQQECPTPRDRLNNRKTEFCQCLDERVGQTSNVTFLDAVRHCTQQAQEAQQRYEEWLRSGGPADDADGDGADSRCAGGDDCDDNDRDRYPGNTEVFDVGHKDEDCDPTTIGGRSADRDGDGFLTDKACNWNGSALVCGTDCNDRDPSVRPTSPEVCDGKDNNCNGDVDEGVSRTFYADTDGDRFGDPNGQTMLRCSAGPGWVANRTDCDDTRADINPRNGNCRN
jgi:PAN domain/Putative metal-binding motif